MTLLSYVFVRRSLLSLAGRIALLVALNMAQGPFAPVHGNGIRHGGFVAMRSMPAHMPQRSRVVHLRARQRFIVHSSQAVSPPARFAVPGWTDEQTEKWLDDATPCEGCGG